jgi:hypothetical protein
MKSDEDGRRKKLSMFEQYDVRPEKREYIPEIWKYRAVVRNGRAVFGAVKINE